MPIRTLGLQRADYFGTSCEKSFLILERAHKSAGAFLHAYDSARSVRTGGGGGTSTDDEQDLLRAMLVMSSSGLDSMMKQLIRDTLSSLADSDEAVGKGLLEFVEKRVKEAVDSGSQKKKREFLSRVLVAHSQRDQLVEEYIGDLTSSSLQSGPEIVKVGNALGVHASDVSIRPSALKPIFDIRNQIIHEMDINFSVVNRSRHPRAKGSMVGHANSLLALGEGVLQSVKGRI